MDNDASVPEEQPEEAATVDFSGGDTEPKKVNEFETSEALTPARDSPLERLRPLEDIPSEVRKGEEVQELPPMFCESFLTRQDTSPAVEREIADVIYDEFPRRTTTIHSKTEEPYISRQPETVSGRPTRRLTRDMVEGVRPTSAHFTSRPVPEYEEEVASPDYVEEFMISRQPTTVSGKPTVVSRQPTAVSRQPTTVSRQPSVYDRSLSPPEQATEPVISR